jgi:hypothetical protein
VNASFLQRALAGGALLALVAVAGVTASTFSPDQVQDCKSDATCQTIKQTGSGQALVASAVANNGSVGTTANPSSQTGQRYSGIWGEDISSDGGQLNVGVSGSSVNGVGMYAQSNHWVGLEVRGGSPGTTQQGIRTTSGLMPAFAVTGGSHSAKQPAPPLIDGCASGGPVPCSDSAAVFKVANNGAITVAGCTGCGTEPTLTSSGRRVDAFAARSASPQMEDVGEGQLVAGRAFVRLDPAFAETLDRSHPYLVELTPEGPSRGLYVAERGPNGFSVRENPGGTSSLTFTYRIVAKPFDSAAQRLPADER